MSGRGGRLGDRHRGPLRRLGHVFRFRRGVGDGRV
jgi:hypothetical protein